jgi:hypothetical protein
MFHSILFTLLLFIWIDDEGIHMGDSLCNNIGITDKSVPVLKEMLQSSHFSNSGEEFVPDSFSFIFFLNHK